MIQVQAVLLSRVLGNSKAKNDYESNEDQSIIMTSVGIDNLHMADPLLQAWSN